MFICCLSLSYGDKKKVSVTVCLEHKTFVIVYSSPTCVRSIYLENIKIQIIIIYLMLLVNLHWKSIK